ncbi:hypothetical protein B4064_1463 [Caldibacillus thermoamylovorans]|uniref:Uncharacterized protein n=1 Tax=Caldibacillus thermoamylovorans TaxID=35841 RepID=A0ABD4A8U6_9BACI|nr:hypothetical protein B4166_3732 [Caldibacillus thermoamylovorans]KIO69025.1 hypothetical protein B4064_1463 [Caldibacillus thermoamylovorans]KIO73030.1 hypothetical protein B4167_2487 [Caldibacillus thermoamylovorans]
MKLIGKMGKIFSATWQIKRIIIAFLKIRGSQSPLNIVTCYPWHPVKGNV